MLLIAHLFDFSWRMSTKLVCFPYNFLLFKIQSVQYSHFPVIAGTINLLNRGSIKLGDRVIINSNRKSNPVGGGSKTSIYCSKGGQIVIGDRVAMTNCVIFSQCSIEIGDGTFIGGGCQIYDTDFHALSTSMGGLDKGIKKGPVSIGKGVFLGCNVIVLKGVTIGEHSVVGAGSIVTKPIGSNEVWAGNPARFIRKKI